MIFFVKLHIGIRFFCFSQLIFVCLFSLKFLKIIHQRLILQPVFHSLRCFIFNFHQKSVLYQLAFNEFRLVLLLNSLKLKCNLSLLSTFFRNFKLSLVVSFNCLLNDSSIISSRSSHICSWIDLRNESLKIRVWRHCASVNFSKIWSWDFGNVEKLVHKSLSVRS